MQPKFKDISALFSAMSADERLRRGFVEQVADSFRNELAHCLDERELVAIDYSNAVTGSEDTCASHSFLDSNLQMNDAMNDVAADLLADHQDAGEFLDLMQSDLARQASSVWGDAWSMAKERGFSGLWSRRSDMAARDLHALAFVVMERPDRSHERYGSTDVRIANELFPPLPEFILDENAVDEAASDFVASFEDFEPAALAELASEIRSSLDELDEARLLSAMGSRPAPRP